MKIGLTDFRAFADTGMIDVRPLTFLVGENSSGKTSFLSALNYIWRFQERMQSASFSQPPFDLGTFDEIVHRVRGRRRPDCFAVSVENNIQIDPRRRFRFANRESQERIAGRALLRLIFKNNAGDSWLDRLYLSFNQYGLEMTFSDEVRIVTREQGKVIFDSQRGEEKLPFIGTSPSGMRVDASVVDFYLGRLLVDRRSLQDSPNQSHLDSIRILASALETLTESFPRAIFASAPVRSNPSRVYTPVDQGRSPEGRHTPQVLFKIKETDSARWHRIKTGLDRFGQMSGMFSKIDVSRYRASGSSPFQISVTLNGKQSNLMDVGYGISQSLPILTDLIEAPTRSAFLFQQPEVHLHPQAQAALGSYFANYLAEHRGSHIIAETHSDYLIDRVRYEVRSGVIRSTDVSILYFEGKGTDVKIHRISLDGHGNIQSAPDGYRQFFVIEQLRLLGIEDAHVPSN